MYNIKKNDNIRKLERTELRRRLMRETLGKREYPYNKENVKPLFSYANCNKMTAREMEKLYTV